MNNAHRTYNYYGKADDIVGYTFRADMVCPRCILIEMHEAGLPVSPVLFESVPTAAAVDSVAADLGIDPADEASFDSDTFPKIVFRSDTDDAEACGHCHEVIG